MESARHIEGIRLGQRFETRERIQIELMGAFETLTRKWVITEIYPFFVKARAHLKDGRFETRCFSLGDLVTIGLIPKGVMDE